MRIAFVLQGIGASAAALLCISRILQRHPQLLHSPQPFHPLFKTRRIAHRGGNIKHPENTLAAFETALAVVDMIELDIWLTRDGHVAVLHDGTFSRVCGGAEGHVHDVDYCALPRVAPAGNGGSGTHAIPLLADVLDLVARLGKAALIEVKSGSTRVELLLQQVYEMVSARGLGRQCLWFSLDSAINDAMHRFSDRCVSANMPALPTVSSATHVMLILLAHLTGVLPFLPMRRRFVLGITAMPAFAFKGDGPVPFANVLPLPRRLLVLAASRFFGEGGLLYDPSLCAHMRARGVPIWCLGISASDGGTTLRMGLRCGMTAAISDDPEWLGTVPDDSFARLR